MNVEFVVEIVILVLTFIVSVQLMESVQIQLVFVMVEYTIVQMSVVVTQY